MRGDAGFPVRVRFAKLGKVRFVSHRDVARAFERAFRIEQLPLAFTQGFSPRPKVSFGLALGVGHESLAEYLDVELAERLPLGDLPDALSTALPEGIDVTGVSALAERAPALQESVTSVDLHLRLAGIGREVLHAAVDGALAADTLPVTTTRKGREVVEDLRPALCRLVITEDERWGDVIAAEIATRPRGARPADVVTVLRELVAAPTRKIEDEDRVLRTRQWIERDGARWEPLEADRAARTTPFVRVTNKGLKHDRRDNSGGNGLRADHLGDPAGLGDSRRIA